MTFNFDSLGDPAARVQRPVPRADAGFVELGEDEAHPRCRALLIGQPNVGKSVVFSALTGTFVAVSNYPGTTVEITRGRARFGDRLWEVIDTPGTQNLVPMSEDEAVTRDILVSSRTDALVQVGDAKNLARTLLLTLQIAELGVPFCLDLNMLDEARARGIVVDLQALERELAGVRVNASTATEGEGLDGVREYLASQGSHGASPTSGHARTPLACAPHFPEDVEAAIAEVEANLDGSLSVSRRAVATMLLGGARGIPGALAALVGAEASQVAQQRAAELARAHGVPTFALLSRLRLTRAQAIVRAVQRRDTRAASRGHLGHVSWTRAAAVAAGASLIAALTYDGALTRTPAPSATDPLASYGVLDLASRGLSRDLLTGWSMPGLALLVAGAVLGAAVVRRHARARTGAWKLVASFAGGWTAYWGAALVEGLVRGAHSSLPVHLGAAAGLGALAVWARAGDGKDAAMSHGIGRASTHPLWGLPLLAVALLLAYKVVGVFGAGTAVDFIEHRVFGHVNQWAFAFFDWVGVPLLTAFFVGPYGLITMGVTYAVAIVLPVVATFFFVFSMLEDSGYLPRLAVMSNRLLRSMGLNGKAVLPMVLGLGCDTMATLTARIMETRKERMLVTLLLALGIPCSSQLSVIFALMQRTSHAATFVWLAVMLGTLLGVGWVAARALPGDKSDFLLEMPPMRQPMVSNILAKTMARIEWYLKEAVPLFLIGTALLFVLDATHVLVWVHRAGEPIVHHLLGFPREAGVADRVSEALLVGFLRRDFGAAGLLDLARAGKLSPADVAVSMVTITLFIPCIANVFMIAKERGWKVAGAMSAFIFPYAIAVGAVVRVGFRVLGGS
jgi:Fe2+ transport system protein B